VVLPPRRALPDLARKAADPFLNDGFAFTETRQKRRSGFGVALRTSFEALFNATAFLNVPNRQVHCQ